MSAADTGGRTGLAAAGKVRAWDLPTRLFHWLLLALILDAYVSKFYSSDANLTWHRWNGYSILILLVFRLIWGLVGGSTSRLGAFLNWPWTAARYAYDLARGRGRRYLSHNPLGTWMIVVLFLAAVAQAVSGLFTPTEFFVGSGPLSDTVSEKAAARMSWLHHRGFYLILILAGVHVAVNLGYQFLKRDPVVAAMITGLKPRADYIDQSEARYGSLRRAGAVLAISAALVLGTIRLLGGSL